MLTTNFPIYKQKTTKTISFYSVHNVNELLPFGKGMTHIYGINKHMSIAYAAGIRTFSLRMRERAMHLTLDFIGGTRFVLLV